jgi:hypothetical protein
LIEHDLFGKPVSTFSDHALKHVRLDQNDAALGHPERFRCAYRQVEDAAATEWASIVDDNDDASTARRISNTKPGSERQCPMGRRKAAAAP